VETYFGPGFLIGAPVLRLSDIIQSEGRKVYRPPLLIYGEEEDADAETTA
jgi:hypothetical protein